MNRDDQSIDPKERVTAATREVDFGVYLGKPNKIVHSITIHASESHSNNVGHPLDCLSTIVQDVLENIPSTYLVTSELIFGILKINSHRIHVYVPTFGMVCMVGVGIYQSHGSVMRFA